MSLAAPALRTRDRFAFVVLSAAPLLVFSALLGGGGCAGVKAPAGPRDGGGGGQGSDVGADMVSPILPGLTELTVTPPMQAVTVVPGGTAMATYKASGKFQDGSMRDLTNMVVWSTSFPTLAPVVGGVVTARAAGTFTITAASGSIAGTAKLMASMTGSLTAPTFPPADATPLDGAATMAAADIKYPVDGALFPSNWGAVTVHVAKTNGSQTSARIAITGPGVDLKYYGACEMGPNPTTACYVTLPTSLTSTLAGSSDAGDLTLTARVTGPGGTVEGKAVKVAWAPVALSGGLYYWTATATEGTAIARYNFEGDATKPQLVYSNKDVPDGACIGCHAISRDGTKMALTLGGSYPAGFQIVDVATGAPITYQRPPTDTGYAAETTFNPDGSRMVNMYRGKLLLRSVGATPMELGAVLPSVTDAKTDAYWSPTGKLFAFATFKFADVKLGGVAETQRTNGDIKNGSQIWITDSDGMTVSDQPRSLVPVKPGFTSYYPAISDDDAFVVFNQSDCAGPGTSFGYGESSCDGYDDVSATLNLIKPAGGTPTVLTRANGAPNSGNSWPQWSPDHGKFRGKDLYWLAFSSRRPYGLAINQTGYAASNPQLWFAAITTDDSAGGDPSFAAVWLPGQNVDLTTPNGNHVPVWVERVIVIE